VQPARPHPRQGPGHRSYRRDADRRQAHSPRRHALALGLDGVEHGRCRQRPHGLGGGSQRVHPRRQGVRLQRGKGVSMAEAMGFFTDTTVCIGCKACEVACKEWNQLPAENGGVRELSGDSYDNTRRLDGIHWRHVRFIEQFKGPYDGRWLMMSDVCKHCVQAGCLEVCPTGAIIRTEFHTVVIQSDVCNGCRACIAACPFGVIDVNPVSGTAQKCTLCYDRLKVGLEPACSKACPTDSIQFGSIVELRTRAHKRVDQLKAQGVKAELYGGEPDGALGGLNSFYLLVDEPEVYGLPRKPALPSRNLAKSASFSVASAGVLGIRALVGLRKRRMDEMGGPGGGGGGTN